VNAYTWVRGCINKGGGVYKSSRGAALPRVRGKCLHVSSECINVDREGGREGERGGGEGQSERQRRRQSNLSLDIVQCEREAAERCYSLQG
jgi:hypothetical protein